MKCSLKWLRQYVDINLSPEALAKRMTLAGTEVSHIEVIGGWDNVYIGQIAGMEQEAQRVAGLPAARFFPRMDMFARVGMRAAIKTKSGKAAQ